MDFSLLIYPLMALFGYLVGAFPTGYLVVKQVTGQDIRTIGSGGTGATNVRRAAGGKAALFVLFVDFHKGLIPVMVSKMAFPHMPFVHVIVAATAVIGHSKSVFLNFSGGKSAATGLGGMVGLTPLPAIAVGLLALLITRVSRYQSLASITASVCAPIFMGLCGSPIEYIVYTAMAGFYVIYLHKANIVRLLNGTENKL
jgi:glycerol-3-phosphate acyltransferase PlsY